MITFLKNLFSHQVRFFSYREQTQYEQALELRREKSLAYAQSLF